MKKGGRHRCRPPCRRAVIRLMRSPKRRHPLASGFGGRLPLCRKGPGFAFRSPGAVGKSSEDVLRHAPRRPAPPLSRRIWSRRTASPEGASPSHRVRRRSAIATVPEGTGRDIASGRILRVPLIASCEPTALPRRSSTDIIVPKAASGLPSDHAWRKNVFPSARRDCLRSAPGPWCRPSFLPCPGLPPPCDAASTEPGTSR